MEAKELSKEPQPAVQLTLRIRHPSMDPAEISRALEVEAEHSFRAGDSRTSSSRIVTAAAYSETYWIGLLPLAASFINVAFPGDARSQLAQKGLEAATGRLTWPLSLRALPFLRKHAEFLRHIRAGGGQVSLLIAIATGEESSFLVPPAASQLFADLGVTLEFELSGE